MAGSLIHRLARHVSPARSLLADRLIAQPAQLSTILSTGPRGVYVLRRLRQHSCSQNVLGPASILLALALTSGCGTVQKSASPNEMTALRLVVAECSTISSASSELATDVGLPEAIERDRRLRQFAASLNSASATVKMVEQRMPAGVARSNVEAVAGALKRFSSRTASYVDAVPAATTQTDPRTLHAFAELLSANAEFATACARLVDPRIK